MMPLFANPAGLWALLGVPAILAIHFLQQRSRAVVTSTWFLVEQLAPDSTRGRTLERLRTSRQLWLQLLAVLLAAWLLAEPRWILAESAQTVVVVLDASAAMEAFRAPALAAAEKEINETAGLAARTTWVVMTTDSRQAPLYRGGERTAALAALARWQPERGQHDLAPALRLAHGLIGASGRTLLITDSRAKVPAGQRAAGVGRVLANVGFAGVSVTRDEAAPGHLWRALVQNHATTPQRRSWHVEVSGGGTALSSPQQSVELAAGALSEISGRFPEGVEAITVVLDADEFPTDDRLALVRPVPKPLLVSAEGTDAAAEFLRKIAGSVEGVRLADAPTALRLAQVGAAGLALERRGGIFWPMADGRKDRALATEPVTPDRDALVAGLNWQGWIGAGPYGYAQQPGDTALLWQGRTPLLLLRNSAAGRRQLLLAFDWGTANAAKLASTVLLVRRFVEAERDAQRAPYAANFDAGSAVALVGVGAEEPLTLEFRPVTGEPAATRPLAAEERRVLRAPARAGFFALQAGAETLVRGAAQFADARQGDFSAAETFSTELPGERAAAIERNTRADPWAPLWLLGLGAALLGSWWERGGRKP
jgi:hypothetical protein